MCNNKYKKYFPIKKIVDKKKPEWLDSGFGAELDSTSTTLSGVRAGG